MSENHPSLFVLDKSIFFSENDIFCQLEFEIVLMKSCAQKKTLKFILTQENDEKLEISQNTNSRLNLV